MNKDQVDGRLKKHGGKVKEATGKALDKPGMEYEGKVEQVSGQAQASYGDIKSDINKRDRK